MPTAAAIQLAQERDVDLVEVASAADPPVTRLLDYGKFRYEQSKKERESRKTQKNLELREVRMRPRIDTHDIAFKSRMVKKFLSDGHKVRIFVLFRGREITHPELAMGLMRRVAEDLQDEAKLEKAPAMEGRTMTMVLAPLAKKPVAVEKPSEVASKPAAPAATKSGAVETETEEKASAKA
jgi:translation initiation factor IF-3